MEIRQSQFYFVLHLEHVGEGTSANHKILFWLNNYLCFTKKPVCLSIINRITFIKEGNQIEL